MVDILDFLELAIPISQAEDDIPDSLFLKIFNNSAFESADKGADILYILIRCFHHINFKDLNDEEIQNWINKKIEQLVRLSKFEYTNEDKIILNKYVYYEYYFNNVEIYNRLDEFVTDIDNVLSISINAKNGIWLAKEELRLAILRIFSMNIISDKYINFLTNQLMIAKANQEVRERLLSKYSDIH